MVKKGNWFFLLFGFLGGVLLLFIILPFVTLCSNQSLENLVTVVQEESVLLAFLNSFILAAIASSLAILFGTPLAYLLSRRMVPISGFWHAIVDLPLAVPHSIVGIALLFFLGGNSIFGALFNNIFRFGFVGTRIAIVAAMLFVSLPYAVNAAKEAFDRISVRIEQVAASLGAPPASVFFRVSLPLAKGGIFSGAILTWARAVSEFGAVVVLAYHPMTAPVKIWDEFTTGTLERAGAIAVIFLFLCLSVFIVLRLLLRKQKNG
jgi:molybdate/tungstate transport system permease protein